MVSYSRIIKEYVKLVSNGITDLSSIIGTSYVLPLNETFIRKSSGRELSIIDKGFYTSYGDIASDTYAGIFVTSLIGTAVSAIITNFTQFDFKETVLPCIGFGVLTNVGAGFLESLIYTNNKIEFNNWKKSLHPSVKIKLENRGRSPFVDGQL